MRVVTDENLRGDKADADFVEPQLENQILFSNSEGKCRMQPNVRKDA